MSVYVFLFGGIFTYSPLSFTCLPPHLCVTCWHLEGKRKEGRQLWITLPIPIIDGAVARAQAETGLGLGDWVEGDNENSACKHLISYQHF